MKKGMIMIVIGAVLVLAQVAGVVYDAVAGELNTVLDGVAVKGAAYAISYLAAGLAGLALVAWGLIKLNRDK